MIELQGLTEHQCDLLDVIWSIESMPEVEAWIETLNESDQQECHSLIELLHLETLDQRIRLSVKFPDASKVINHVRTL